MSWVENLKKKVKAYFTNMYKKSDAQTDAQLSKQGYSAEHIRRLRARNAAVKQQDELFRQMRQK